MFNSSWKPWTILMSSAIPAGFITIFSATVDFGLDSKIFRSILPYRLLNFVWIWNELKTLILVGIPKSSIWGVWSSNGRAHCKQNLNFGLSRVLRTKKADGDWFLSKEIQPLVSNHLLAPWLSYFTSICKTKALIYMKQPLHISCN